MNNGVSSAAQVIIAIIPIVAIVMGSVVVFFYLLWTHRERRLRIEMGSYNTTPLDMDTFTLLAGILLVAVGLALTVVFASLSATGYTLLGGIIPLATGAGLLVFNRICQGRRKA